ncbi:MAG: DUF4339 domain-containing protein [Fuerstiella sp.]
MARYWIRNRGRVQGPFSDERIQGLLRRGRFSRHFHVSEDRKNWYPASDFPELFQGVGGPEPAAADSPFSSGGSPFDDDDDDDVPPASLPTSERRRPASQKRRAAVAAQDDDDDDDDEDEWEDDEDWEDDHSAGILTGFIGWIEANTKVLAVLLLLVLCGLSWFVFMREDFTEDAADLKKVIAIQSRVMQAYQTGAAPDQWISLLESTEAELQPMVTRLEKSASAMDHVKQELLFLARDDIPRMFKELPQKKREAAERVKTRISMVDEMIKSKTRFHEDSAMMPQAQPAPPQQPPVTTAPGQQTAPEMQNPAAGQPGSAPVPGQQTPGQQTTRQQTTGQPNGAARPGGQPAPASQNGGPAANVVQPPSQPGTK